MKKLILTFLMSVTITSIVHAQSSTQSLNLVTYVPVPIGFFDALRLAPHSQDPTTGQNCDIGTLYVASNNKIWFCDDGTWGPDDGIEIWTQSGDDISLSDTSTPENKKVGIGTSTPEFKLTLDQDGGIIAKGTYASGVNLTTTGAGTRLIWYPKKAAFRAGRAASNRWDDVNIGNYSVAMGEDARAYGAGSVAIGYLVDATQAYAFTFGSNNTASAESAIALGHYSVASALSSTVSGGSRNTASGTYSVVGGGGGLTALEGNTASGNYSTVSGGGGGSDPVNSYAFHGNTASGGWSFIGGGHNNVASGRYSTIGGGRFNQATGTSSTICGGGGLNYGAGGQPLGNTAGGFFATVCGGADNDTGPGSSTTIAGGESNKIQDRPLINSAPWSSIGGGQNNIAKHEGTTIAGGQSNKAWSFHSTVGGGYQNEAGVDSDNPPFPWPGEAATVSGGNANKAQGIYSTVSGGSNNLASGQGATISGGEGNTAAGDYSWAGGLSMQLTSAADNTFVWGQAGGPYSITTANAFLLFPNSGGVGSTGRVGIGTPNPQEKLDVVGNIKLGDDGAGASNLFAVGCQDNIRMIKGYVNQSGTPLGGSGFTSTNIGTGVYQITFTTPFTDPAIVVATPVVFASAPFHLAIANSFATGFQVYMFDLNNNATDGAFQFIAVGGR